MVEPWLRGTLPETDALRRGVLHAFQQAGEDAEQWCVGLSDGEINLRPLSVAPVAFHLKHIPRSLDRLLSYAEGRQLGAEQIEALEGELTNEGATAEILRELQQGLAEAAQRVMALPPVIFEHRREVGRHRLSTTVGALLVHCAEHTQRHTGQAITTTKIVLAMRTPI